MYSNLVEFFPLSTSRRSIPNAEKACSGGKNFTRRRKSFESSDGSFFSLKFDESTGRIEETQSVVEKRLRNNSLRHRQFPSLSLTPSHLFLTPFHTSNHKPILSSHRGTSSVFVHMQNRSQHCTTLEEQKIRI